jgi:hypothetical protein
MSTVHLQLPDDLRSTAEARAAREGFSSLDQYITSLILADQLNDAPAGVTATSEDQLKQMLLEGLSSGAGREISNNEWEQKRQSLIARHAKADRR